MSLIIGLPTVSIEIKKPISFIFSSSSIISTRAKGSPPQRVILRHPELYANSRNSINFSVGTTFPFYSCREKL